MAGNSIRIVIAVLLFSSGIRAEAAPTTNSSMFVCYKSIPKDLCINAGDVCNFVKDCPSGEDELPPYCVRNPTIFSDVVSLDDSGWTPSRNLRYQWQLIGPKSIPLGCLGACPTLDSRGGFGQYAAADSATSDSEMTDRASLTQEWPGKSSGPQCKLSFNYFHYKNSFGIGAMYVKILEGDHLNDDLWYIKSNTATWGKAVIPIGRRASNFSIQFIAEPAGNYNRPGVSAVDNIAYENCENLVPKETCKAEEFHCPGSQACINKEFLCDFNDDCADGKEDVVSSSSDESSLVCETNYTARCPFDHLPGTACDLWGHDTLPGIGSYQWSVTRANKVYQKNPFRFDHTTHNSTGYVLLLNHEYIPSGPSARYKSTKRFVVLESSTKCHLRFWLYYFSPGADIGSVYVLKRTSYRPFIETYLANYTTSLANAWTRQSVAIPADVGVPFEIVFLGYTGYAWGGAIAIDDISMTSSCRVVDDLLPGQEDDTNSTISTPQPTTTTSMLTTTVTTEIDHQLTSRERDLIIGLAIASGMLILTLIFAGLLIRRYRLREITKMHPNRDMNRL